MAILIKNDQQLYKGRGPLDSKSLVKTYAELLNINTWTKEDTLVAYNGMIVAVWLNKDDTSKNGIYFLFDPNVTTAIKKPDVANEANWHRFADISDIVDLSNKINSCSEAIASEQARAEAVEAALDGKIAEALQAAKDYADENDADTQYDDTALANRVTAVEAIAATNTTAITAEQLRAEAAEAEILRKIAGIDYVSPEELEEITKDFALKTYVDSEIDALELAIANLSHFRAEVVGSVDEVTEAGVLYLVKDESVAGVDKYNEYIVVNGEATLIGDTTTDLSNYYTKAEIDSTIAGITSAINSEVEAREALAEEVAVIKAIDNATQAELDAYKLEVAAIVAEAEQNITTSINSQLATKVDGEAFDSFKIDNIAAIATAKQEAIDAAKAAEEAKGYAVAADVALTYATKEELNTYKGEVVVELQNYAKKTEVAAELAKKIETGAISHTTEAVAEGVTVEGTSLKIVVDAFTKAETRDYVAEVIGQMTGGESAADVLVQLNNYKASNDERVGAIETKNGDQDAQIAAVLATADDSAAKLAGIDTTVLDYINAKVAAVVTPKSSDEITVADDGTLGIGEVSTDKLKLGNMTLVICGGDAYAEDDEE